MRERERGGGFRGNINETEKSLEAKTGESTYIATERKSSRHESPFGCAFPCSTGRRCGRAEAKISLLLCFSRSLKSPLTLLRLWRRGTFSATLFSLRFFSRGHVVVAKDYVDINLCGLFHADE